ncbi:MAG: YhcH/YjgK/YiaL family protein [Rhodocyclaceae bacterium]|nr:YhcH/YjgK/YiaL family protein [Rhodocyclaceae bacterium]
MFSAYLKDTQAWDRVLDNPIWRTSLQWLAQCTADTELGDYPLGAPGWFANVHTYATQPEPQCIWESHAATVDVQYVIAGAEGIRWAPVLLLGAPLRHIEGRDRIEWRAPAQATTLLTMRAGMFAVFLAGEGHCPMIALDGATAIRKAVVKIPKSLLSGSVA